MEYFTKEFDKYLLDIGSYDENNEKVPGFYTFFPQMLPWVGNNYGIDCKKLLLIGESHYLPKDNEDISLLDPKDWYNEIHEYDDESNIYDYTNTRGLLNGFSEWNSSNMYKNPAKIIQDLLNKYKHNDISKNPLSYIAFYNYFLRPAVFTKSIKNKLQEQDIRIARDTFIEIVGVLKPDAVCFLSKLAYENFSTNVKQSFDFPIGSVPHPACSWWNKVSYYSNGLKGKEQFEKFLTDNKIFAI